MRLANLRGRATLITRVGTIDIAEASGGRFPSDPDDAIAHLTEIGAWYQTAKPTPNLDDNIHTLSKDLSPLGPPITKPNQVFAIGLNYADHGAETGLNIPEAPMVFTKFPSSIAGPADTIPLPGDSCDWEVELVVVIGAAGRNIPAEQAVNHIAGFCIGQDISDRETQMIGNPAQFSLAKSHRGFSPIGPWLTTIDELANPADLAIAARVDEETVQSARTSDMIFDIPTLISYLSSFCELRIGDLIFTGTPSGVGYSRSPARYLKPGQVLTSSIECLGQMRNPTVTTGSRQAPSNNQASPCTT